MTTMSDPTNALATREYSLAELARRIDLNVQSGWGLEKGSAAQLNLLALYCQKHRLLPGDDVTLYEGQPWITVDGRVKLMRSHKDEYRGHHCRPLSKEEKETWGYDPEDLVIETTVRTVTYGEISAHGKVSKAERLGQRVEGVRHNPVARHHPVEIATKRSLSRAERFTFGTDNMVDDEDVNDAVRTVIQERNDPARIALQAAEYDRIAGAFYPEHNQAAEPEDESQETEAMVTSDKDPLWKRYKEVWVAASAENIAFEGLRLPIGREALKNATETLVDMVAEAKETAATQ